MVRKRYVKPEPVTNDAAIAAWNKGDSKAKSNIVLSMESISATEQNKLRDAIRRVMCGRN